MKKIFTGLVNYLFFCGIPRKDYNEIKAIVWARNRRVLKITSILSAFFSLILLVVNLFTKTDTLIPYILLATGSLAIYLIVMTIGRRIKNAYSKEKGVYTAEKELRKVLENEAAC